jgi:hypothetical protein
MKQLILESKSSQKILFFKELIKDLTRYKKNKETIWKNKNGHKIIIQPIEKELIYWISYKVVWSTLQENFNMQSFEVREFIKKRLSIEKKIEIKEVHRWMRK